MHYRTVIIAVALAAVGILLVAVEFAIRGFWLAAIGVGVATAAGAAVAALLSRSLLGRLRSTTRATRRAVAASEQATVAASGQAAAASEQAAAASGQAAAASALAAAASEQAAAASAQAVAALEQAADMTARHAAAASVQAADMTVRLTALDRQAHAIQKDLRALGKQSGTQTSDLAALILYQDPPPHRVDARGLPLVMISQAPRSGGTLLTQLFDGHPDLLVFPHELKWGGEIKHAWPKVDPADGPQRVAADLIASNLRNIRAFNLDGYAKAPTLPTGHGMTHRWSYWRYVESFCDEWTRRPPASRRDCLDLYLTAYFSALHGWKDAERDKRAVVAFTPGFSLIESQPDNVAFFADYPNGRLICVCRNPVDWFASASRHSVNYENPDSAMALWAESARSTCALKNRYGDRVTLLTFETLVKRPRETMIELARVVGVPFDDAMLTPTFNGCAISSNSSFHSKTGIDRSVLDRAAEVAPDIREQIAMQHMPLYEEFMAMAERF